MQSTSKTIEANELLDSGNSDLFDVHSSGNGPSGSLPLTAEMLLSRPSGEHLWPDPKCRHRGLAGPGDVLGPQFLILSTQGEYPRRGWIAHLQWLGYHTGHYEVGLLMREAARELEVGRRGSLCRVLQRSLRWPHAGDDRHVRQPGLSQ